MPILCLHGIAQEKNDPEWLRKLWDDSLILGFVNAGMSKPDYRLEVPFYGDLLAGLAVAAPPAVAVSVEDRFRSAADTPSIKAEVEQELARRMRMQPIDIDDQMRGVSNTLLQLISKCLYYQEVVAQVNAARPLVLHW